MRVEGECEYGGGCGGEGGSVWGRGEWVLIVSVGVSSECGRIVSVVMIRETGIHGVYTLCVLSFFPIFRF